jgi:hypothetical protein
MRANLEKKACAHEKSVLLLDPEVSAALSEELECIYVWMKGWDWCLRRDKRGLVT